jgi:hypothetical protein
MAVGRHRATQRLSNGKNSFQTHRSSQNLHSHAHAANNRPKADSCAHHDFNAQLTHSIYSDSLKFFSVHHYNTPTCAQVQSSSLPEQRASAEFARIHVRCDPTLVVEPPVFFHVCPSENVYFRKCRASASANFFCKGLFQRVCKFVDVLVFSATEIPLFVQFRREPTNTHTHTHTHRYNTGKGVKQSDKEAVRWFALAAHQGFSNSQVNLGFMYEYGKGLTKNETEAVR